MTLLAAQPHVSIILLSLLRQDETRRCIDSLFSHTVLPFEIIIVDMGASEDIVRWLRDLETSRAEISVIYNSENEGTSRGRNQGAQLASAQQLIFLDNDTEVTTGWLEPLIDAISSDPSIAACGAKIVSDDGMVMCAPVQIRSTFEGDALIETGLEFTRLIRNDDPAVNSPQTLPWYPTTGLLVKREHFEQVGGFDERLFLCEEDKDLGLSLSRRGYRTAYIPESVIQHHHVRQDGDYAKIRNNLGVILRDVKYFEQKWQCKVFIRHTRAYLRHHGLTDPQIDNIKRFSFVNTILEHKLNLSELIVTVTNRCNHRCAMCYYHEHLNSDRQELTLDKY